MSLIIPLAVLVLMWAVLILPQQRRVKAHQAFVDQLGVGDEVITTSGVFGTITALDDETASLRIADGVEITIARLAIGRSQHDASNADDTSDAPNRGAVAEPSDSDPIE